MSAQNSIREELLKPYNLFFNRNEVFFIENNEQLLRKKAKTLKMPLQFLKTIKLNVMKAIRYQIKQFNGFI